LIIEAIPVSESNQARRYRGYMAVDDIVFKVNSFNKNTFKIIFIFISVLFGLLSSKILQISRM